MEDQRNELIIYLEAKDSRVYNNKCFKILFKINLLIRSC